MNPATEKPNILWLCTDQQRYDTIASLGNHLINTPAIDSLVTVSYTHLTLPTTPYV